MRPSRLLTFLALVPAGFAQPAPASQVNVPVNSATSSLNLQLCANPGGLGQDCDDETKPLTGFITVALDNNGNPSQIALRNFDLQAIGSFNLNLSWAFGLARVDATASNLRIYHARPGVTNPPVPVAAGAYTFAGVPFFTEGTASYTINQFACDLVGTVPCSSNINLATLGENQVESLSGTLQVANGVLTLNMDLIFETPLDDMNPDLGTLRGHAIIQGSAALSQSLVPPGADWKYLDDGSKQGGAWSLPGQLDDSAWPLGPAQLGYGDGDEMTVVGFGPNPASKHITTYFRHTFNVLDTADYTNLALRVLSDDGVVVYLNGAEVYRANMPEGTPSSQTLANTAVSGAAESIYFLAAPPSLILLNNGLNLLAAEIHQSDIASSDISFDLELAANTIFSNTPPAVVILSPTNNAVVPEGSVPIQVSAVDTDGIVTRVALYEGSNLLGERTTPPYNFTWPNACAGTYALIARAYDDTGAEGVSAPVVVNVTRPPISLVSTGASWRYLDNGSDQGIAWRNTGFNDASWAIGTAQLGFGDGDETTTINGGPALNRFITTYFRHVFNVANAGGISTLNLRLLRDDGAVVYLNGMEIFRNNMPAGAVTFLTLASTNAAGADETSNYFPATVSAAMLVNGANVLAVEVHQGATNSSDLSFSLGVTGSTTNQPPSAVAITTPANNAMVPRGATVPLQASAQDPDGAIARVEYFAGTNKIGQATSAPYSFNWVNAPAGYHILTARAVDGCGASLVSAPVTAWVGAFSMVHAGSTWRYRDNGSDQGTAWRAGAFNDAAWSLGAAELGYGDGGETTVINGGPATNRFITTYFRHRFLVPDASVVTGLVVRLLRDDGAVIYLNGQELFRSNMPTGAVNHLTPALLAVAGQDEMNFFATEAAVGALLQSGVNLLAVEIHQQAANSSDVSFDLQLIGLVGPGRPALAIRRGEPGVTLQWPSSAAGLRLQTSINLGSPANWQYQSGTPTDDGAWKILSLPLDASARFFRLAP